jgi:hypothetical protein
VPEAETPSAAGGRVRETPERWGPEIELSVVIPCLDEAEAIAIVVGKAREAMRRSEARGEVIVVDNGSTDGSPQLAETAGEHAQARAAARQNGPVLAGEHLDRPTGDREPSVAVGETLTQRVVLRYLGQRRDIPAPLADELYELAQLLVTASDRPDRFAEQVPLAPFPGASDRLVGFLGRAP